ncbi:MAG TPA: hypothetical protein PLV85_12865, partial [Polyangiaceae bacterium]|nr:hypothetical protein [Polyangiaceae bacterium]
MGRGSKLLGISLLLMLSCVPAQAQKERTGIERTPPPTQLPRSRPAPVAPTVSPQPRPAPAVKRCPEATSLPSGYVCIEPGTFVMGSPSSEDGRDSDEDQHRVTLTRGFMMKAT